MSNLTKTNDQVSLSQFNELAHEALQQWPLITWVVPGTLPTTEL